MSFQAYLDTVKAKTGKTPDDFKKLAKEKGLVTHAELLAWLKTDFQLGHGHANAIIHAITGDDKPKLSLDEQIAKHFGGAKANWRKPFDDLMEKLNDFGADVALAPTSTYISILRKNQKFAIVQVTTDRLDVGIKLKDVPAEGRYEESGKWNPMVTHRVRVDDPKQLDAELLTWLKKAYEKA